MTAMIIPACLPANPDKCPFVLTTDTVSETDALMVAPRDIEVIREAPALAAAMALLLENASHVLFIDGWYSPLNHKYRSTLHDCLKLVKAANHCTTCEIHCLEENCPPPEMIEHDARALFGKVIPSGMTVTIYRWHEKTGGADFHARYLLTNRGGMRVDAGFSAEGGHQKTDVSLMDFAMVEEKLKAFEREAGIYELVEPVLQIAPSGYVEHV